MKIVCVAKMSRRENHFPSKSVYKFEASLDLQWIFHLCTAKKEEYTQRICKEKNIILCGLHSLRII